MRFLILPTHFPRPESMGQGDIAVWMNWIREETDEIMKQLEEERDSRSDPDGPFNGTANGVFLPLQDPLSLSPPVQTPKQQENNSENSEPSQNSWENVRKQNIVRRDERTNEAVTPTQGEPTRILRTFSRIAGPDDEYSEFTHSTETKPMQCTGTEPNHAISTPNTVNKSESRRGQLDYIYTNCGAAST